MITSKEGLDFIKRHEGYSAIPYKDVAGVSTIGYGHAITHGEVFGAIANGQASALLAQDVRFAENVINEKIDKLLSQHEFDALVDFVFNLGSTAFGRSTMLKMILSSEPKQAIAEQFKLWCNAGGKIIEGLVKRREDEKKLFLTGDYGA